MIHIPGVTIPAPGAGIPSIPGIPQSEGTRGVRYNGIITSD